MIRLFISLYLMVLASFFIFLGFSFALDKLDTYVSSTDHINKRISSGTFKLLDESIQGLSAEQQRSEIKKYQDIFGQEFALVEISEIAFNSEQKDSIEAKDIVVIDDTRSLDLKTDNNISIDKTSFNLLFRKHLDTSLVWRIHFDIDTDFSIDNFTTLLTVEGGQFIDGMFFMLTQKLVDVETNDLNNTIKSLEPNFGLPLKLLDQPELTRILDSDNELKSSFNQKKVINISQGSNFVTFVQLFSDNSHALQVGPVEIPWFIRNAMVLIILTFVFSIATALFIWLWPLWSNLLKIKKAANEFGEGNYSARIPFRKRSAIAPVAQAFNAMAERTERSINTQKELTTAVSHELRTPVARMRFALEMLEQSDHEADKSRYTESLNIDIDDLDLLLEELLSYARFDQDNTSLDLRLEKITPWLSNSMDKLMPLADTKLLNYQIEGIGLNESANFEPRLMSRVLDNLVQNALRYAENKVEVTLRKDTFDYVLTVEDDGKGISKKDQTQIFDAFSRIDTSRDRSTGGFGLGLAIADRIIKAHKGSISIEDSKLGGALFIVRWPIK